MSNQKDYSELLAAITKIASEDIIKPNMPVDAFLQEAENLYKWAMQDKTKLVGAGLDWTLVSDLQKRAWNRLKGVWP